MPAPAPHENFVTHENYTKHNFTLCVNRTLLVFICAHLLPTAVGLLWRVCTCHDCWPVTEHMGQPRQSLIAVASGLPWSPSQQFMWARLRQSCFHLPSQLWIAVAVPLPAQLQGLRYGASWWLLSCPHGELRPHTRACRACVNTACSLPTSARIATLESCLKTSSSPVILPSALPVLSEEHGCKPHSHPAQLLPNCHLLPRKLYLK